MKRRLAPAALAASLLATAPLADGADPAPGDVSSAQGEVSFAGCARQPDGHIVLASTLAAEGDGRAGTRIALTRLDENGNPDERFGEAGVAVLHWPDGGLEAAGVTVAGNGSIVVAATARRAAAPGRKDGKTVTDALVARFLANGQLDRTFAGRGWLVDDLGGDHDFVAGVDADPQGGILVAASSLRPFLAVMSRYDFSAWRVAPDGGADPRFGKAGKAFVRVGSVSEDKARSVLAAPDGGLYLAGLSRHSATADFTVVRLTPAGARDIRFGTLGWKILHLSEKGSTATAMALQPDGKLLVAGEYVRERKSPGLKPIVVRLAPSGAFDDAFAEDGIAELKLADAAPATFRAVASLADGRILAAGTVTEKSGQGRVLVARFLANGKPDPQFGFEGAVRIPIEGRSADARSLFGLPGGGILACGQTTDIGATKGPPSKTGHVVLWIDAGGRLVRQVGR